MATTKDYNGAYKCEAGDLTDGDFVLGIGNGMQRPNCAAGIANCLLHEVRALRHCIPLFLQPRILCKPGTETHMVLEPAQK